MITFTEFNKYFNRSFWRAYNKSIFPIDIPKDRKIFIKEVYDDIASNKYIPSKPECDIIINKGDGVARITHAFSIRDSMVYYFCIKELEDILCKNRIPNTFGGWSLGGKIRKAEDEEIEKETEDEYGRYSFNPQAWSQQFGEFNSLLFSQLETGNYSHVIQFDLANFYDLIRLDILEKWIRDEVTSEKEYVVDLLFNFLTNWDVDACQDRRYQVGLPQEVMQDCSRILANFYLQRYDNFTFILCEQYNSKYFRYADDQFILTNNPEYMSIFMLSISKRLNRYGLKINQKKVKIWTAHDLIIHRSRHIQMIFKEDEDKKNPEKVLIFAEACLMLLYDKVPDLWNRGTPLLRRLLWANLASLPPYIFRKILEMYLQEDFLLESKHSHLKKIYELCRFSKCENRYIDILTNLLNSTNHNSFHYEVIKFSKEINKKSLNECALRNIKRIDDMLSSISCLAKI